MTEALFLIDELVEDLRAKGELDEEALKGFKRNVFFRHVFGIFFLLFLSFGGYAAENNIGFAVFGAILGGYFWFLAIISNANEYLLNTTGIITKGVVLYSFMSNGQNEFNTYCFGCEFFDEKGNKYKIKQKVRNSSNTLEERPEVGSEVDIIYLPDNPQKKSTYRYLINQKKNLRKVY